MNNYLDAKSRIPMNYRKLNNGD
jgi:hypothetical protein